MSVPASILNFPYQTGEKTDGVFADFHADGSLKHVGFYRAGKLIKGIDVDQNGDTVFRDEKFFMPVDMPEDEQEQRIDFVLHALDAIVHLQHGTRACGFCEKTDAEVKTLIAGVDCYICNECVGLCNNILNPA